MKIYRLYIDESGDHTFYGTDDISKRYLGLTSIIIVAEYYRTSFQTDFEILKQTHFPHSPDEPVIIHREDIVHRRRQFWRLRDSEKEQAFNIDLLKFLEEKEYCVISVVIDKNTHIGKYGDIAYHPYHYCITALLERYCGFLNFYNSKGDVMAESRGGTEDKQLKVTYKRLFEGGTRYRGSAFFQKSLTSSEIKLKPKWKNIAGLQIADILAHPCTREILADQGKHEISANNFGIQICQRIKEKYNKQVFQERISGYGKIYLG